MKDDTKPHLNRVPPRASPGGSASPAPPCSEGGALSLAGGLQNGTITNAANR